MSLRDVEVLPDALRGEQPGAPAGSHQRSPAFAAGALDRSSHARHSMIGFRAAMEWVGTAIDGAGVIIIVIGALFATVRFAAVTPPAGVDRYRNYRQTLGRAILLGLEFLVAGDIIRTVVVAPTLANVVVLGGIVVIRTFLSMSLELELEGHWPWQRRSPAPPSAGSASQPGT